MLPLGKYFYPKKKQNCYKISVASFVQAYLSVCPFWALQVQRTTCMVPLVLSSEKTQNKKRFNGFVLLSHNNCEPFKREREGLILHAIVTFLYTEKKMVL
jgi:hypothetical protein